MQKQAHFFFLHKREELSQMPFANLFTYFLMRAIHSFNTPCFFIYPRWTELQEQKILVTTEIRPHQLFTSSYLTYHCCLRPILGNQVTSDSPFAQILPNATPIPKKPRYAWQTSFQKIHLHESLVKLFLLRNMLRLRIKRRGAFPYSPSETGRLRMLQQNTSKRVKRIPLRENLPALRSSLGYFELAVSCLNILMKKRYLEAKQLLRHLRVCWNSQSSALQVHAAYKFLLYQFSHPLTPHLVPTPHSAYTRKPRTVSHLLLILVMKTGRLLNSS